MIAKFLILLLLLITLVGCKDSNNKISNKDENEPFDINKKYIQIKSKIQNDMIDKYSGNYSVSDISDDSIKYANYLSTFNTKILTNDSNRYNNISIVSDRLNGYILNPRRNFFF